MVTAREPYGCNSMSVYIPRLSSYRTLFCRIVFGCPALANLRAALMALASANASPQGGGGAGLPGCVVLVSNLNEKVCEAFYWTCDMGL